MYCHYSGNGDNNSKDKDVIKHNSDEYETDFNYCNLNHYHREFLIINHFKTFCCD